MNDSCDDPNPPLIKCMKSADFVLTKLLPVDTNPRNFYWKFRRILKLIFKLFINFAFTTDNMTNEKHIQLIINRLKTHVGQNIMLFSHRKDYEGIKDIQQIARKNQLKCGYIPGLQI